MRQIGSVESEALSERFVDYLKTIEISAQSEEDEGRWIIWVKDENRIDSAREELNAFKTNPEGQQYKDARQKAYEIRSAEVKKRIEAKKNFQPVGTNWGGTLSKRAPVVLGLIVTCIGAALFGGGFGTYGEVDRWLMFTDLEAFSLTNDVFGSIKQGRSGEPSHRSSYMVTSCTCCLISIGSTSWELKSNQRSDACGFLA